MRKIKRKDAILLTVEGISACRDAGRLLDLLERENVRAVFFLTVEEIRGGCPLAAEILGRGQELGVLGAGHGLWRGPVRQWEKALIGRAAGEKYGLRLCGYRPAERFLSPFARRCVCRAGWKEELLWNREILPAKGNKKETRRLLYGGDILRLDCRLWEQERLEEAIRTILEQMRKYGLSSAAVEGAGAETLAPCGKRQKRKRRADAKKAFE